MIDISADLKSRFDGGVFWFLEKWEIYGVNPDGESIPDVLTDKEHRALDILENLSKTVAAVPPSAIKRTEQLYNAVGEEKYEKLAMRGVQVVGFGFYPNDATEFVEALNGSLSLLLADA